MEGTYAKMTFILHNTLMPACHSFVSEMANEQKKTLEKFGRYTRNPYLCTRKTEMRLALLAQLVEQLTLNQWVQGSNP